MAEINWIRPGRMPEYADLTEPWLDRLGIPPNEWHHFMALSRAERLFHQAIGILYEDYTNRGLLEEGHRLQALVNNACRTIDKHWLRKGAGRQVNFKHAMNVLMAYNAYKAWADALLSTYASGAILLAVEVEYHRKSDDAIGTAVILVHASGLQIRRMYETRWEGGIHVSITETPDLSNAGLAHQVCKSMPSHDALTSFKLVNLDDLFCALYVHADATIEDLQRFLNKLAYALNLYDCPQAGWMLQFEVDPSTWLVNCASMQRPLNEGAHADASLPPLNPS